MLGVTASPKENANKVPGLVREMQIGCTAEERSIWLYADRILRFWIRRHAARSYTEYIAREGGWPI